MRSVIVFIISLWFSLGISLAQESAATVAPERDLIERFDKITAMVPMRDGVRLYTEIYLPKDGRTDLPILFWRSPYNVAGVGAGSPGGSIFNHGLRELAEDGYIFAFQDIRGRHKSEGAFVMLRPSRDRTDPKAVDESTDAYDSIAWFLDNLPNHNGRVGMLGVSYPAWLAVMAAIDPHPALKAVSPQASPADLYKGDDFFHNGAFRLSYGFEYVTFMERDSGEDPFAFDQYDTYAWYLSQGGLANLGERFLKGYDTTWDDFVAHPVYDRYWRSRAVIPQLEAIKVPSLTVGGWYDSENLYGPLKIHEAWRKRDPQKWNYLVMGPWNHGGWLGEGRTLGELDFGSDTAAHFRREIMVPWFAHFLKDRDDRPLPRIHLFETGANQWRVMDDWPEKAGATSRKLYFGPDGKLSFTPPREDKEAFDRFVSDPAKPVPYRPRPIESMFSGPGWSSQLVVDQRFAASRPDVLTWMSEPLESDLVLSGGITARLFAATTGSDSDWIVKLIDVYPDVYPEDMGKSGYQLMVAGEIMRGRYRKGLDKATPIEPGVIESYEIDLQARQHRFRKGHRIMVQVQSSWFPLFDRNPQKFVDNIFTARDSDFEAAEQTVYRSRRYPSHLEISVAP